MGVSLMMGCRDDYVASLSFNPVLEKENQGLSVSVVHREFDRLISLPVFMRTLHLTLDSEE